MLTGLKDLSGLGLRLDGLRGLCGLNRLHGNRLSRIARGLGWVADRRACHGYRLLDDHRRRRSRARTRIDGDAATAEHTQRARSETQSQALLEHF